MPNALLVAVDIPMVAPFGAIILLLLAAWLIRWPVAAMGALLAAVIAGQLFRLPLPGQGGGLLLSDFLVVIVVLAALLQFLMKPRLLLKSERLLYVLGSITALVPFFVWSAWCLFFYGKYPEVWMLSLAYWIRLLSVILLFPAIMVLIRQEKNIKLLRISIGITIAVMAVAGIFQYWFMPDMGVVGGGWDPHQRRLVVTWFDPNFVGALLGVGVVYVLGLVASAQHSFSRWLWLGVVIVTGIAMLLTKSRSTLIAFVVAGLFFALFFLARLVAFPSRPRLVMSFVAAMLILTGLLGGFVMLGERAAGLFRFDATVQARWEAFKVVWPVAREYSLVGVGYNAYQFAALEEGLIGDYSIHSRGGADSSVLTLWVTTGLLGVVLFFAPWALAVSLLVRRWLLYGCVGALVGAASILLLFTHSQFVNSFLYAHLLIVVVAIIALGFLSLKEDAYVGDGGA